MEINNDSASSVTVISTSYSNYSSEECYDPSKRKRPRTKRTRKCTKKASLRKPKPVEEEEVCFELENKHYEDLQNLESQFNYLKAMLANEKLNVINQKISGIVSGTDETYQAKLAEMELEKQRGLECAEKRRQMRLEACKRKYEATTMEAQQSQLNNMGLAYDELKSKIKLQIEQVQIDRILDFNPAVLNSRPVQKCMDDDRKKPRKLPKVSGPYIVYQLKPEEILEDWTFINKVMALPKRKIMDTKADI